LAAAVGTRYAPARTPPVWKREAALYCEQCRQGRHCKPPAARPPRAVCPLWIQSRAAGPPKSSGESK